MKVMLIGIDGMDYALTRRWLPALPNFRRLADSGAFRPLQSVFPPDSVPAWISFYLGEEPGEHGVLDAIDYVSGEEGAAPDVSTFAGRTLWDVASRAGKRVAVLNAFLAYPVWPVNGAMISGPVFTTGHPQSYPDSLLGRLPQAHLGGFVEFPSAAQLPSFARATNAISQRQAWQAVALARDSDWDLFFVTFLTLDRAQHFYWRFHDPTDPTHPGESGLSQVIFEHYRLMDRHVGWLMDCQPPGCATVVLSDHGHGRRPTRLFHLNEWLRRDGLLATPPGADSPLSKARLTEFAKRHALQTARRCALEDALFSCAQLLPRGQRQSLHKSEFALQRRASLACRDPVGGNSPYGGIRINSAAATAAGLDPECLRGALIRAFRDVRDPSVGERITEWVAPREDKVSGRRLEAYPDILYQLRSTWGTDPSLFGAPFSDSPLHRRLSGGHRPEGVLFVSEEGTCGLPSEPRLTQLRDWLLGLL